MVLFSLSLSLSLVDFCSNFSSGYTLALWRAVSLPLSLSVSLRVLRTTSPVPCPLPLYMYIHIYIYIYSLYLLFSGSAVRGGLNHMFRTICYCKYFVASARLGNAPRHRERVLQLQSQQTSRKTSSPLLGVRRSISFLSNNNTNINKLIYIYIYIERER
jgi:hypothetical protein